MKSAVACPEPERRRNEPATWTSTTTTGCGNVLVAWVRIDTRR